MRKFGVFHLSPPYLATLSLKLVDDAVVFEERSSFEIAKSESAGQAIRTGVVSESESKGAVNTTRVLEHEAVDVVGVSGTIRVAMDGTVEAVDQAVAAALGYTPETMCGTPVRRIFGNVPPYENEQLLDLVQGRIPYLTSYGGLKSRWDQQFCVRLTLNAVRDHTGFTRAITSLIEFLGAEEWTQGRTQAAQRRRARFFLATFGTSRSCPRA